jgi:hypothetical protein
MIGGEYIRILIWIGFATDWLCGEFLSKSAHVPWVLKV